MPLAGAFVFERGDGGGYGGVVLDVAGAGDSVSRFCHFAARGSGSAGAKNDPERGLEYVYDPVGNMLEVKRSKTSLPERSLFFPGFCCP